MDSELTPDERARAEDRRRRAIDHVVRPGDDVEEFDAQFWSKTTKEQRVDVLWGMVQVG